MMKNDWFGLKNLSMELVPPNKVHPEEAKPGDGNGVGILNAFSGRRSSLLQVPLTNRHV